MNLRELFDRPAEWYWEVKEQDHMEARFTVNNVDYVVLMGNELIYDKETDQWEDMGVWEVEFQDPTLDDPHSISGKLGSLSSIVFATVISILIKFKTDNPTLTLKFTAKEASRQKLYNRILGILQQKGYKVHAAKSPTGKMSYLVK